VPGIDKPKKAHLHHIPDVGVEEEVRAALAAAGCALDHRVVGRMDERQVKNFENPRND
jgi:hypothetical protein